MHIPSFMVVANFFLGDFYFIATECNDCNRVKMLIIFFGKHLFIMKTNRIHTNFINQLLLLKTKAFYTSKYSNIVLKK